VPNVSYNRFLPSSGLFFLKCLIDPFLLATVRVSRRRKERVNRKEFTNKSRYKLRVVEVGHEGVDYVLGRRLLCSVRGLHQDGMCG
jgi:hypothetical protein